MIPPVGKSGPGEQRVRVQEQDRRGARRRGARVHLRGAPAGCVDDAYSVARENGAARVGAASIDGDDFGGRCAVGAARALERRERARQRRGLVEERDDDGDRGDRWAHRRGGVPFRFQS